jgi:hypothetical protein
VARSADSNLHWVEISAATQVNWDPLCQIPYSVRAYAQKSLAGVGNTQSVPVNEASLWGQRLDLQRRTNASDKA